LDKNERQQVNVDDIVADDSLCSLW